MRLISKLLFTLSLCTLSTPLAAETLKLKNGAELLVEQDLRSPRDSVSIVFGGGAGLIKPEEQGLTQVLTSILNEGPADVSNAEFKKKLFLLGGEIGFGVGSRNAYISIAAPSDNLGKVIQLALATLKNPKFDEENYKIALAKVSASVAMQEENMSAQLRYFAVRDAFANHPDVLDGSTSRSSLKNLSLAKVKATLPKLFDAKYLLTAAVGPSAPANFEKTLNAELESAGFLAAKLEKRSFKSASKEVKFNSKKVVLLNKPGATDNQVRYIVRHKLPVDNADAIAFNLANRALGSGMQSSLFKVLREERGLTYSAGSGISENLGMWAVVSFASTDKLGKLLTGIDEVVNAQAKSVIDQAQATLLKGDALTQWKESRELPSDRLMETLSARIYGRNLEFIQNEDDWITKSSDADITRLGKTYFSLKNGALYVMGDKTKLMPVFKSLGYKEKDVRVVELPSVK